MIEDERYEENYQDQLARSKRMAKKGEQHPFFKAGQSIGAGDADEQQAGDDDDDEDDKPKRAAAAAKKNSAAAAAEEAARTKVLRAVVFANSITPPAVALGDREEELDEPIPPPRAPRSQRTPAPAVNDRAAASENEDGDAAPASVSDEEIQLTMREMMRRRARDAAEELKQRKAAGHSSSFTGDNDRWPIPPHILDPTGLGMSGPGAAGAGGELGVGMGMGGLGGGAPTGGGGASAGGFGMPSQFHSMGLEMGAAPGPMMRSRL